MHQHSTWLKDQRTKLIWELEKKEKEKNGKIGKFPLELTEINRIFRELLLTGFTWFINILVCNKQIKKSIVNDLYGFFVKRSCLKNLIQVENKKQKKKNAKNWDNISQDFF